MSLDSDEFIVGYSCFVFFEKFCVGDKKIIIRTLKLKSKKNMKQVYIAPSVTDRTEVAFRIYMREISKFELLSVEKELEIVLKVKYGDQKAKELLLNSNLRFVVSTAKTFLCKGVLLADLVSAGNMGLIHAIGKFDETRGFKFISYAVWWIRDYIMKEIERTVRIIRLPNSQIANILKIRNAKADLEQLLEREPTDQEILDCAHLTNFKLHEYNEYSQHIVSLDRVLVRDGSGCLLDVLPDDNIPNTDYLCCDYSLLPALMSYIDTILQPRIALILKHYYGLDGYEQKSIGDIGRIIKLSKERTRKLKDFGIATLKNLCVSNKNDIN